MKIRTWMWTSAVCLCTALVMANGMAAQDTTAQHHKPKHQKYRLVDLGTFGGPNSNLSGPTQRVLNNRGVFAAYANTSAANPNPGCYNRLL